MLNLKAYKELLSQLNYTQVHALMTMGAGSEFTYRVLAECMGCPMPKVRHHSVSGALEKAGLVTKCYRKLQAGQPRPVAFLSLTDLGRQAVCSLGLAAEKPPNTHLVSCSQCGCDIRVSVERRCGFSHCSNHSKLGGVV